MNTLHPFEFRCVDLGNGLSVSLVDGHPSLSLIQHYHVYKLQQDPAILNAYLVFLSAGIDSVCLWHKSDDNASCTMDELFLCRSDFLDVVFKKLL